MSSEQELISDQGLRLDGRRANELRRIQYKMGVFTQPDGSAYFEQGNTKVLVAVYGPHKQTKDKQGDDFVLNCQYSMATFSTSERKNRPRGDRKSEEMAIHLKQSLSAAIMVELYERSQIDVFVEILEADGGQYCASVNAATLALVDAGICLREYVCACTASIANGDIPLLDVSHIEEVSGGPTLCISALPTSEKVALLEMSQRFHLDHLPKVLKTAMDGCKEVQKIIDKAVREYLAVVGAASDWGLGNN